MNGIISILQAFVLFLIATIVFDLVHYALHLCMKSKNHWLRKMAAIHLPHHRFFNVNLQIREEHARDNMLKHVLFENGVQLLVILCGFIFLPFHAVILAASFQVFLLLYVWYKKGSDLHHLSCQSLPAVTGGWFVSAPYHALHHFYANNFYSSYIKILDFILGTAHHLQGKNIVMTGANGALGSNMKKLLEKEGATVTSFQYGKDYQYGNYEKFIPALKHADILFLCHGSKFHQAQEANCDSYVDLIELYRNTHQRKILPPEIWATGSEIECHPCFGIEKIKVYARSKRNYAMHARKYYYDNSMQYRHLVHAAFMSQMGPGLMTASFAATATLFMIKRGFRYVPVTYTGFGWLNYLRFLFYGMMLRLRSNIDNKAVST